MDSREGSRTAGRWLRLAGWLGLTFAAASAGAMFAPSAWYAELAKPPWSPPGWLFGPVWTALYAMMSVAVWIASSQGDPKLRRSAQTWYVVQLALNALWTPIFFGLRWMGLAFIEILLLWVAIVATMRSFRTLSSMAAWLLAPYLAWVTFAALLNFTLWRLNP